MITEAQIQEIGEALVLDSEEAGMLAAIEKIDAAVCGACVADAAVACLATLVHQISKTFGITMPEADLVVLHMMNVKCGRRSV